MKDIIARLLTGLIALGLIGYTLWLRHSGARILGDAPDTHTIIAYIFVLLIGGFLLLATIKESTLPDNRRSLFLLGAGVIWCSQLWLVDDPSASIFLADIVTLVGVYLCIAGPSKFLISKDYKEKKFEEEVEIIEV